MKIKRRILFWLQVVIFIIISFFFNSVAFSQKQKPPSKLENYEESKRIDLEYKMNTVIKMQRDHDWAKLFLNLPLEYTQGETKAQYIKRHKLYQKQAIENNFREFTAYNIKKVSNQLNDEIWLIEGCGEWLYENSKLKQYAYLKAYLKKNQWFITEVLFDLPLHGGFIPCPGSDLSSVN